MALSKANLSKRLPMLVPRQNAKPHGNERQDAARLHEQRFSP